MHNGQDIETNLISISRRMDKENVLYTDNEIFNLKKEENPTI